MQIGEMLEHLSSPAVLDDGEIGEVSIDYAVGTDNPWLVLFFYPADFTFVCPTELRALNENLSRFDELDTAVWAVSTDGVYVHDAWREYVMGQDFRVTLVADRSQDLSRLFECLDEMTGMAYRCTVILDPQGTVRFYSRQDNAVGRSVQELLRIIAALQACDASDGDVACEGWQPGDPLITPRDESSGDD
jgi:alkyl hydroperoxide reductase subunit AhpC